MATIQVPTAWVNNPSYDAHFLGAFQGSGVPLALDSEAQLDHKHLKTVEPGELTGERQGDITVYTFTPSGFVYTEGWDKGFAGEGDPYGIQAEYLPQSANPDAAVQTEPEPVVPEV